jgi:hypothetical protein
MGGRFVESLLVHVLRNTFVAALVLLPSRNAVAADPLRETSLMRIREREEAQIRLDEAKAAERKGKEPRDAYEKVVKDEKALPSKKANARAEYLVALEGLKVAEIITAVKGEKTADVQGKRKATNEALEAIADKTAADGIKNAISDERYATEGLDDKRKKTDELAKKLGNAALTQAIEAERKVQPDAANTDKVVGDHIRKLEAETTEARAKYDKAAAAARTAVALEAEASQPPASLQLERRLYGARRARCATALCWGGDDDTKHAIEPVVDLPISLYWALGNGSLANHINGNRLQLSVAAGVRYWFAYDVASVGLILAQPSLANDEPIRIAQSDQEFPSSAVSRPFPTLMLGFWGDVFMVTVSYDQLRNRRPGGGVVDESFRPGEVVSRTVTLGVSLNVVAATRNAIGASQPPAREPSE